MTDIAFEQGEPDAVAAHEYAAWQGAAPVYSDFIAPFTAYSGQLALHMEQANLSETDNVLDVGCGPGQLSQQLALHAGKVTGIDFAEAMIEEAGRRFPDLEFLQADAESVPFEDAQFDVVIVNYCAHHLARPGKVFAELKRVLKPGGRLSLIHPIQIAQPSWGSFVRATEAFLPSEALFGGPLLMADDPASYLKYLEDADFRDVSCRRIVKPLYMETLDPLLIGGWAVAGLGNQPKNIQDEIRATIIANTAPYKNEHGTYEFPDEVLVARAVN